MSARDDSMAVLRYLKHRYETGDVTRYTSVRIIAREAAIENGGQYSYIILDDLESRNLVSSRLSRAGKSLRGVPRVFYQITTEGIDLINSGGKVINFQSVAWTGRLNISETKKNEIRININKVRVLVESSRLSNSQRVNALAILSATEILVETSDPLWPEIMRLLRSPVLANVTGVASLVLAIITTILTAASI